MAAVCGVAVVVDPWNIAAAADSSWGPRILLALGATRRLAVEDRLEGLDAFVVAASPPVPEATLFASLSFASRNIESSLFV